MLRRIPRLVRSALVAAVLIAVSATVWQSWSAGTPGAGGWTQTEFGPLGPADRNLLIAVRLAGLWEGPTGEQAELQASSADVREVGRKLAQEHTQLDQEVRTVANQLGVLLPSSPNSTQMGWMADISSRTGTDYDRTFVQITREAHGNILPVISEVRGKTRNDLVREFAETTTEFVTRHHQYLESTGLVDYAALPVPPSPGLLSGVAGGADLIVPIAVFIAAILGAIALICLLRNRRGQPERITVTPAVAPSAVSTTAALPALPTAVAALPPARRTDRGPTAYSEVTESGAYHIRSETGPQPVVSGRRRRAEPADRSADTGPFRTATGYDDAPSADDSGSYRARAGSGTYRAYPDYDSGSHRRAAAPDYDSGSHRRAAAPDTDSGSHRRAAAPDTDSGSHRRATSDSDSGSHRVGGRTTTATRSRSRHSVRR